MSKFSKIFEATHQEEPQESSVKAGPRLPSGEPQSPPEAKRRGRPKGKRSDPDFEQVTAYIRRQTYQQVKIALIQEDEDREFSELVEDLLQEWLRSRS